MDKYYREVNINKDITKFKIQLGGVLIRLNEIVNDISEINTDIKNNGNDIKSNYNICIENKNSLIDINREIYAVDNKMKNIKGGKYSINNIWVIKIDLEKRTGNRSLKISFRIKTSKTIMLGAC